MNKTPNQHATKGFPHREVAPPQVKSGINLPCAKDISRLVESQTDHSSPYKITPEAKPSIYIALCPILSLVFNATYSFYTKQEGHMDWVLML